jgi:hypothetical protein
MLKPLLKFSTTLIVWKLASTTERSILEKYSWFVVPDHHWSLEKHPTSGYQMNLNPIYHPLPRDIIVKRTPKTRQREEEQHEARTPTPYPVAQGGLGQI